MAERSRRPVDLPTMEMCAGLVDAYREEGQPLSLSDRLVADIIEAHKDATERLNALTKQVYW
jgi:hypothetical protein